jgi:acetylornithine deacetylase/succinyl-diaminopimelate desuccinylase-like protein
MRTLAARPAMARAAHWLHAHADAVVAEMCELVAVAAPTFAERERGAWLAARLRAAGYTPRTDEIGNVIAATGPLDGCVAVIAHLDTVFPAGTPLSPERRNGRIHAPGIADNVRGLAAMLALARALQECDVRFGRPVAFVASVGEEAAGNLRGVKHLFEQRGILRAASAVIAVDGAGLRRIVHRAVGSRRLRITLHGPGGHSWADFGLPNPLHALTRACARITELPLETQPRTTLTIARLQAGTSVNAIPADAWVELDLRSESAELLARLDEQVRAIVTEEVRAERTSRHALKLEIELIGDRPAGMTPADAPLVRVARAATRAVGERPELIASSTDANVPIACGIPAVSIGAGGDSGGMHTLDEWYADVGGAAGLERLLLTVAGAAELPR